jgi:hypothetical protein
MGTHNEATMLPGHMVDAIRTASGCHDTCMESIVHCLKLGGEHASPAHIRLLIDCAAICESAANFMLRSSDYHGRVCGVCADICDACANDCERFQNDDMMRQCAELCRLCAQSCREMA